MRVKEGKSVAAVDKLREQVRRLERTNRELNERVLELDCLYQILRSLATTLSLDETTNALRSFFVSRFDVERFALFLKDEDGEAFVLRNSYRLARESSAVATLRVRNELRTLRTKGYVHRLRTHRATDPLTELFGADVSVLLLVLRGSDGSDVGLLGLARRAERGFPRRDVELLRKLSSQVGPMVSSILNFERTKELSFTDPLTGIHNRRHFNQVFVREFERARRYGRTLSVLMIDIDHFKVYNDTLGHLAGDSLLRRLAQELSDSLRRTDFVARYGGEEFVVLLPETDYERARKVAEKLRRHVEATPFEGEEIQPEGKITISVGVATYPRHSEEPLHLLELADRSLYMAKEDGRNRVGPSPEKVPAKPVSAPQKDPRVLD